MNEEIERRMTPRADVAIKIECTSDGAWMVAHDVSLGGMLVTTTTARWPGQLVPVRFTLPGEPQAIRCTCRVVDLVEVPRGIGLSLKFLRLAPEALLTVHRYVDKRPLPPAVDERQEVMGYIHRMIEDCAQLTAIAKTPKRYGHLTVVSV
ncbi:MAG: PilZ domain-containing protein [Clostridia bacterium]|nr:PilZ domain-containing protein [Deltaproteobacteria bacterium]